MLETINLENLGQLIKLKKEEMTNKVYKVETDIVYDADINPREIDKEYAENIPLSAPPVMLGLLEDKEDDFYGRLFIIDGNHRMYSLKNVHNSKYCLANIKKYENMDEAIIDAFRLNINHGRRLTDTEIFTGIKRIAVSLKKKNSNLTSAELCKIINIPKTSFLEYIHWNRIENIINDNAENKKMEINKIKANILYSILSDKKLKYEEKERENFVKIFYEITQDLSKRKTKELVKYFIETERICSYEEYLINKSLEEDSAKDKMVEEIKEVLNKEEQNKDIVIETHINYTQPTEEAEINIHGKAEIINGEPAITEVYKEPQTIHFENNTKLDGFDKEDESIEEIPDPDDFVQTTINQPIIINETVGTEYIEEERVEEKKEISTPMITKPTTIINEGKKIDFIVSNNIKDKQEVEEKQTNNNDDTQLVSYKGLSRKLKFETVMENIFDELQENVLSSHNLLNEVLDNEIHNHRREFEEHKQEYLTLLNNSYAIIKKMMLKISKVNKDFTGEN